jgi:hypothetical protein
MNRYCKLALLAVVACSGCTTVSLTAYTVNQSRTAGECRDQAVLDSLAAVAANPDTLPSFALYANGITTLQDTVNPSYTATWAPWTATKQMLALTASRSPRGLWTVSPVTEYERLQALHAACLWALFGPERPSEKYPEILGDAQDFLNQKPHFGVASRLAKLPPGWLHVGGRKDVPSCACYKAHCGHTWVWVLPDDAEAFAQLVLVFQDIATLDINIVYSPPLVVQLTTNEVSSLQDVTEPTKAVTITTTEPRAVKLQYRDLINKAIQESLDSGKPVPLTRAQWLEYTVPWPGLRTVPLLTPGPSLPGRAPAGFQLPPATSFPATRLIRPAPELRYNLPTP